MTEKAAYTIAQFVEAYGIGKTKLHEEINSGRLKARKTGSRTIIAASDAESWLERLPVRRTINAA